MADPPLHVTFGDYELDEARNELRHDGVRVDLQPKPPKLLFYLVRHRDRVVPGSRAAGPGLAGREIPRTRNPATGT